MPSGRDASRIVERKQSRRRGGGRPDACSPAKPAPEARDLIAGPEVKLLKISRAGALIESDSRLGTGSHICLRLNAGDATFLLKGRVLRSRESIPEGRVARYESAVAFDDDFVLQDGELPKPGGLKPARGCRPQPAAVPASAYPPAPFTPSARGFVHTPTILSEALVSGQTGMELRRILGIL